MLVMQKETGFSGADRFRNCVSGTGTHTGVLYSCHLRFVFLGPRGTGVEFGFCVAPTGRLSLLLGLVPLCALGSGQGHLHCQGAVDEMRGGSVSACLNSWNHGSKFATRFHFVLGLSVVMVWGLHFCAIRCSI